MYYPNAISVLVDFRNGAEFAVSGSRVNAKNGVIKSMRLCSLNRSIVVTCANGKESRFNPDGTPYYAHINPNLRLRFVRFVNKVAPITGKRADVLIVDDVEQPFLKRFVLGEPAYCPKTRETVKSVAFVNGAIEVTLVNGDGIERVSSNYDHEGKHRWIKERSLVVGELPPLPKPVTYTGADLHSTAPAGVYEEVDGGSFKAVVLLNGPQRSVLFVQGSHVDVLSSLAWNSTRFTKTSQRFTGRIG